MTKYVIQAGWQLQSHEWRLITKRKNRMESQFSLKFFNISVSILGCINDKHCICIWKVYYRQFTSRSNHNVWIVTLLTYHVDEVSCKVYWHVCIAFIQLHSSINSTRIIIMPKNKDTISLTKYPLEDNHLSQRKH